MAVCVGARAEGRAPRCAQGSRGSAGPATAPRAAPGSRRTAARAAGAVWGAPARDGRSSHGTLLVLAGAVVSGVTVSPAFYVLQPPRQAATVAGTAYHTFVLEVIGRGRIDSASCAGAKKLLLA